MNVNLAPWFPFLRRFLGTKEYPDGLVFHLRQRDRVLCHAIWMRYRLRQDCRGARAGRLKGQRQTGRADLDWARGRLFPLGTVLLRASTALLLLKRRDVPR